MRSVVSKVESAIEVQAIEPRILQACVARTDQAVQFCPCCWLRFELPDPNEVIELPTKTLEINGLLSLRRRSNSSEVNSMTLTFLEIASADGWMIGSIRIEVFLIAHA